MYDHTEWIWDIPSHRMLIDGYYYLTCRINPSDAAARGIADGARVRVFNDRGSFELLARVTDRARPGCVVALSIWWKKLTRDGRNANEVTSQALTDIGRAPTFYDCRVEVRRAGPG